MSRFSRICLLSISGPLALVGSGCGDAAAGGAAEVLRMYPSAFGDDEVVQVLDYRHIREKIGSFENVEKTFRQLYGFGIYQRKVTAYYHCDGVTVASGEFSVDEIRETLSGRSYKKKPYSGVEIYTKGEGKDIDYAFLGDRVAYSSSGRKLKQVIDAFTGKSESLRKNSLVAEVANRAKYRKLIYISPKKSSRRASFVGLLAYCYSAELPYSNVMMFHGVFKFDDSSNASRGLEDVKPHVGDRFRKHKGKFVEWDAWQKGDFVIVETKVRGEMKEIVPDFLHDRL